MNAARQAAGRGASGAIEPAVDDLGPAGGPTRYTGGDAHAPHHLDEAPGLLPQRRETTPAIWATRPEARRKSSVSSLEIPCRVMRFSASPWRSPGATRASRVRSRT